MGGHVLGAQARAGGEAGHDSVDARGMPPDAVVRIPGRSRQPDGGVEPRERRLPSVAPDVEPQVGDVGVEDRRVEQPVGDDERPRLVDRAEVPDDARAGVELLDAG
jgi:hypothetical protein